jgi:hypothetical protein
LALRFWTEMTPKGGHGARILNVMSAESRAEQQEEGARIRQSLQDPPASC